MIVDVTEQQYVSIFSCAVGTPAYTHRILKFQEFKTMHKIHIKTASNY